MFVAVTDDLKEQISAGFIDGQISQLVQNYHIRFEIFGKFLFQTSGGLCSDQCINPKTSVFVIGDEFSNAYSSNPYQNKFWLTN